MASVTPNDVANPDRARDPKRTAVERERLHDRIERDLSYYPAETDDQRARHQDVRAACRALSHALIDLCPPSRHLSLALTHVEDAMHDANHAVAQGE